MPDLRSYRRAVDALKARLRLAEGRAGLESAALERAEGRAADAAEARGIVQAVAQSLQQRAHANIARVVSRCLDAVFDDPYEFRIDFDRKRGKTEARMVFVRGGVELDDPLNEVGGGVVDVAAFALRLACLLLSRPRRRRLLVLDEPWRNVRGAGNRARTRTMMERLAAEMGVQIVLNTDVPEYRLGKVIELPADAAGGDDARHAQV